MDSSNHFHEHQQEVTALLRKVSGQDKEEPPCVNDHNYNVHWSKNPDPNIKTRPARLLFMNKFPSQSVNQNQPGSSFGWKPSYDQPVDVEAVDQNEPLTRILSFVKESNDQHQNRGQKSDITVDDDFMDDTTATDDEASDEFPNLNDSCWTPLMKKLWARAIEILDSDRLARLTYTNHPNELILKKNLTERTASKFRLLFSATAFWDMPVLQWFNNTLIDNVPKRSAIGYHESMQFLRPKLGYMLERIYDFGANSVSKSKSGPVPGDKLHALINNYKPKRLPSSPLFLIVPSGGPQTAHHILPMRTKYWHNLFGSLGKVITFSFTSKPGRRVYEYLGEIRGAVRDKIRECRSIFSEGRPLFLVGFGHSSLIAAHCALENSAAVRGVICLGFPLSTINGFRGDLDDPLLELASPTLFIIGQNSSTVSIDDIEDFRERITKAETALVVVGGANDQLLISSNKKKFEAINQSMVDRAIADEIHDFVSSIILPHDPHGIQNSISNTSSRSYDSPIAQQSNLVSPLVKRHSAVEPSEVKHNPSPVFKQNAKAGPIPTSGSTPASSPIPSLPATSSSSGKVRVAKQKSNSGKLGDEPVQQQHAGSPAKRIKTEPPSPSVSSSQVSATPPRMRSSSGGSGSGTRRSASPASTHATPVVAAQPTNSKSPKETPTPSISLENIKEENEDMPTLQAQVLERAEDKSIDNRTEPTSQSDAAHINSTTPSNVSITGGTPTSSTPSGSGSGTRHHGFSYSVAEVPSVLSQTATRTGRQIRPPRNLDV